MLVNCLFETPQLIDPVDTTKTYGSHPYNTLEYDKLHNQTHHVIKHVAESIDLIEIKMHHGDYDLIYAVLDHASKSVVYISKCVFAKDTNLGKYVYQSFVWINKSYKSILKDLPSDVIYQILLPKYKVVSTDQLHTPKGMIYWAHLIKKAKSDEPGQYNVYYYNKKSGELKLVLSTTHLSQLQKEYKIWDHHVSGMSKIVIITTKKFKVTK